VSKNLLAGLRLEAGEGGRYVSLRRLKWNDMRLFDMRCKCMRMHVCRCVKMHGYAKINFMDANVMVCGNVIWKSVKVSPILTCGF
jgi:hypothetical protein